MKEINEANLDGNAENLGERFLAKFSKLKKRLEQE
jgi:hypothetical protein